MQWALVNTVVMPHKNWAWEGLTNYEKSYDAQPGTIIDIIVYDGKTPYNPGEGLKLVQVPDDAKRGDTGY
jgi:hypothetical protein